MDSFAAKYDFDQARNPASSLDFASIHSDSPHTSTPIKQPADSERSVPKPAGAAEKPTAAVLVDINSKAVLPKVELQHHSVPKVALRAGDHHFHTMVDGTRREYELYMPKGVHNREVPVVYMMHGFSSNMKSMENDTQMDKLADKDHFAVAYLQALPKAFGKGQVTMWNLEHGALTPKDKKYDDIDYVKKVMANVELKVNTDRKGEYIVGHSEGGSAAQFVAQQMPGKFAGLGTVNSTRFDSDPAPASTQSIRSVFMLAGADPVLAPDGGFTLQNMGVTLFMPKVMESHPLRQKDVWAKVNECTGDAATSDDKAKRITTFDNCKGAPVTEIYRYGALHSWNSTPKQDTSDDLVAALLKK